MERGQFGTFAFFPYSRRWRHAKRTQRVVARLRVSRRSERCATPRHSSRFRNVDIEVPREGCRPSLSREEELRKECQGALSHPRVPQCRRKGERGQYAQPRSPMSCTNMLVAPLSVCEGERCCRGIKGGERSAALLLTHQTRPPPSNPCLRTP